MGFRFRKSINFGPARVNLSKSGIGASFGVKGARITKTSKGRVRKTLSIPGTGLSYVSESGKKKRVNSNTSDSTQRSASAKPLLHTILAVLFFPVTVPYLIYKSSKLNKATKLIVISAWMLLLFYASR